MEHGGIKPFGKLGTSRQQAAIESLALGVIRSQRFTVICCNR
jgi:hypothetical protein